MISEHGNYKCDYCGDDEGNFYTETGNHVVCQQMADAVELVKQAQIQLRATQINWQEDCLFRCDDLLTGALAKLEAK
jgi:hypothetical protein